MENAGVGADAINRALTSDNVDLLKVARLGSKVVDQVVNIDIADRLNKRLLVEDVPPPDDDCKLDEPLEDLNGD